MGTRKSDILNVTICVVLLWAVLPGAERVLVAETPAAREALIADYRSAAAITDEEGRYLIGQMEDALRDCEDPCGAFRLRYGVATMHFKAQMLDSAEAEFRQIVKEPDCPEPVRLCSLNMIAQVCRLEGKNEEAIEAFGRLADLIEERVVSGDLPADREPLVRLFCAALFSKAEIYELIRDYQSGISEYKRLLSALGDMPANQFCAPAMDRISQLYLRRGETEKYLENAETLRDDYPDYYRTPVVVLEAECVKFLKDREPDLRLPGGSFAAPAAVISHIKKLHDKGCVQGVVTKIRGLVTEYTGTYGGVLLRYHYAWFLDTLGEKDEAADALRGICYGEPAHFSDSLDKVITTVRAYAKLQYAIMLVEKSCYGEALQVIDELKQRPQQAHVSDLAESIRKAIGVLEREVPLSEIEEQ